MSDFDVQQVVEAAARAFNKVEWPQYLGKPTGIDLEAAGAALAVIVPAVTQQVRALHRKIANPAPREGAVYWLCGECRDFWPCDTVRKLDELDAAVRGEEL